MSSPSGRVSRTAASRIPLSSETAGDLRDDLVRRQRHVHDDRVRRLLERGELAVEEIGGEEVPLAAAEALFDQLPRSLQVDDLRVRVVAAKDLAVRLLERRAGDDGVLLGRETLVDVTAEAL